MMLATRSKRFLAMLLALIMCLSTLPVGVFASGSNQKPAELVKQGTAKTSKDELVTVEKTAEHKSGNDFEITLKVTTKDQVTTTPAQDTHAVLVIDRSNSMAGDRISSAREAAKTFAGIVLGESAEGNNQVAVVSYSRNYEDRIGLSGDLNAVNDAIEEVKTGGYEEYGGTNIQAGIHRAQEILAADTSDAKKVILVLSDGEPTYSYQAIGESGWDGCSKGPLGGHYWNQYIGGDYVNPHFTGFNYNRVVGTGSGYSFPYGENGWLYGKCAAHGVTWDESWEFFDNNGQPTIKEAEFAKNAGTEIYSVFLGASSEANAVNTMKGVASGEDHYKFASDVDDLAEIFKGIAGSITTPTNAGIVTDPMGQFIILGDVSGLADKGVTKTKNGLTWNVAATTPKENSDGSKTYTVTYPITLDTSANGFVEEQAYATNGTTTFNYQFGGEDRSVDFDVPAVKGYVPEYTYKVEYYKEKTDGTGYELVKTTNGPATDLWTSVEIQKVDEDYQTEYNSDNYHYVKGDPASIIISAVEANNVIKLYYDRDEANVTVNHFYKTDKYAADGTFTKGEYPNEPQTSGTQSGYVGDQFTAEKALNYGGALYTFEESNDTITVKKDASENVINLYYSREVDERADASVVVNHVYRTHTWTLENGKYVLKDSQQPMNEVEKSTDKKATTIYTAETTPVAGFEDFTYDTSSTNSITLQPGENVITLYFDKTVDNREPVSLTVNHHYTKTVVTIGPDGKPATTVESNNYVETVRAYKGETVTLSEQNTYNGERYTSDGGNAGNLTVTDVKGGEAIDLYYTIYQAPGTTFVTVNHIYRTITHETVETTDPETGEVTGTEVVDRTNVDETNDVTIPNLYEGQNYTATQVGKPGYTFNEKASDELIDTVEAGGATVFNLYYDKDEEKDDREAASIDVMHVYTTHLTTIVNGEVKTIDISDGFIYDLPYEGKAGDSFTATPVTTFNNHEYTVVGTPDLNVILQPGTNTTIVINYERSASDLKDTTYTVNYVYNTYTMVLENGVAKYGEPTVETEYGTAQSGYVGQIVTISDGAREGFTAAANNPATEQTLTDGENVYTFVYNKYVPLDTVSVTVNHHYTTTTIAVDGTSSSNTDDMFGTPVEKYMGEDYVAQADARGFTYDRYTVTENIDNTQDEATKNVTVTATGDVVVDFYYSKTVDNSKPVNYSIQHVYVTINWDGTRVVERGEPITGSSYATKQLSAATDNNNGNYKLVSAYFNDQAIPGFDPADPQDTYAVTLVDGKNVIVYTYERSVDNREATQVMVIHNYYARDTYTVDGALSDADYIAQEGVAPEYRTENVYDSFEDGIWVGQEYTATMYNIVYFKDDQGVASIERVYDLVNATPEGGKIASIAALDEGKIPAGNVVTFNLIRDYSTDPGNTTYTVVHEYYTNGSLSGSAQTSGTGKVGATVNAADIAKVTSYEGNTYSYTSASADSITLAADGSSVITLRYDRTTGGGGGGTTDYYKVTINYYDEDGNSIASSYTSPSIREGNSWDYSSKQRETITVGDVTYTFSYAEGDPISGTNIRSDKVVNLYYTSDADIDDGDTPLGPGPDDGGETDIDDGDTPLGPNPDDGTEIVDPETPLGNLPQTGAAEAVNPYMTAGLIALSAAMAAVGLTLTRTKHGKREED